MQNWPSANTILTLGSKIQESQNRKHKKLLIKAWLDKHFFFVRMVQRFWSKNWCWIISKQQKTESIQNAR